MQVHFIRCSLLLLLSGLFFSLLIGCGGDRIAVKFKTPKEIYVDDSQTDTDKLNRELKYEILEAEKERLQKEREKASEKEDTTQSIEK